MQWVPVVMLQVLLLCSVVHANGIYLVAEEHHLWGAAGTDYYPHNYLEYDKVSDRPVTITVSGEYSNPGEPWVNPCASSASAGDFTLEVLAVYDSIANATSTYTFTTQYHRLSLAGMASMQYVLPSSVSLSLYDRTDQVSLFTGVFISFWDDDGWHEQFTWDKEFAVSPDHVYMLSLAASASEGSMANGGTSEWKRLQCTLTSTPQPVPEPASVLLFGIGLAVLARGRSSLQCF